MMDKPFLDMNSVLKGFLLVLVFFGNVDAQVPDGICVPQVRVQKKPAFNYFRKSPLRLPCNVKYCEEIPTIKWAKLDDTDRWIPVSETDQITVTQERSTADEKKITSYLNFKNITKHHDGLYRCTVAVSNFSIESHNINVSVSDTILDTANGTSPTQTDTNDKFRWMPYIIICSGILGLVTVVMLISFLSLQGCKGSRKANNQRAQVPPSPNISKHGGHLHGQEKLQKKAFDSSTETLQPDMPSLYPAMGQANTLSRSSGEPQQIVYATLEHLTPRETSIISQPSREQLSEYASIRIY